MDNGAVMSLSFFGGGGGGGGGRYAVYWEVT